MTVADVNLQVDGSGFEVSMNRLIRQVETLEKKLQKVGTTATARTDAELRKTISDLQKLQGQMVGLERNANSKGFGKNEELRMRREINALEAKGYTDANTAMRARLAAENQIKVSREALLVAAASERKILYENIKTEQLRLAVIKQQEAAIRQMTIARERDVRASSGGPSILPAGGIGTVVARTAAYAAAGTAIFAVAAAAQSAVAFTVELDQKFAKLGAISGSTKGQMLELSETILQIGRNSGYSTAELADAATTLAQAGFSARGISSSLKATADLALAAGTTMAEAVDVVTSAIGSFQLQEGEAANVADSLTAALNKSKLTIQQVALGIQYAGTTAYEQGVSFQELTSIMGAMAQAGVRSGSTMGTGLRQLLVDLQSPSEKLSKTLRRLGLDFKDIDVASLGATQVFKNLSAAGFNSSEAYGALETRAAAAFLVVKNNLPFVEEMQLAQARAGVSTEAAAKAADNLSSQWQRLKNSLGADSTGLIGRAAEGMKDLFKAISDAQSNEYENNIRKQAQAQLDQLGILAKLGIHWKDEYNPIVDAANEKLQLNRDRIEAVSQVQETYADKLDEATTATAKANDQVAKQEATIHSLTQAIGRTIKRQGSLKDGSTALKVETISLAQRFVGLAENLDMSTNSAGDLIKALQTLRNVERSVLAQQAQSAVITGRAEVNLKAQKVDKMAGAFERSGGYDQLKGKQLEQYKAWRKDPLDIDKQLELGDIAKRAAPGSALAVNIDKLATGISSLNSSLQNLKKDAVTASASRFMVSEEGKAISAKIESFADGKDQKGLKAYLATLTTTLAGNITPAKREAFQAWQTQGESYLHTPMTLTEEKVKAVAEKPLVSRDNLVQAVQELIPELKEGSGYRSQAQQDSMYAPGKAGKSIHTTGIGQDFNWPAGTTFEKGKATLPNGKVYTEDYLKSGLAGKGIQTDELKFERGPAYKEGSGPHAHIALKRGNRFTKENESDEIRLANADREAEEARLLSIAKIRARRAVSTGKEKLKDDIKNLSESLSQETYEANKLQVEESFKGAEAALRLQAVSDTAKMLPEELEEYNIELEKSIRNLAEEKADGLAKGLEKFIESLMDTAARATEKALEAAKNNITIAEARLAGLDRFTSNGGFVPSYVRSSADKKVTEAKEAYAVGRTAALPGEIASREGNIQIAANELKNGSFSKDEIASRTEAISTMVSTVLTLKAELVGLEISAAAATQIPTTVSGNIALAVSEWERLRGVQKTWAEEIGANVAPALDAVESGLFDMFNNIANGSRTALQSFGDFAKGMLRYIQQIVMKILASKIIELLLQIGMSAFGGGFSGSTGGATAGYSGGTAGAGGVRPMTLRFNGGPAPRGLIGGGRVTNGAKGYDSVNAMLAKDEFVVRSAAVKSVGTDFMNDLNRNGASAIKGMSQLAVLPTQGKQETNVFVVKPDTAPQMGPNDVLVAIHEDILRDGATKRLIKHVASGG